jgi:hypothetical protein
MGGHHHDRMYGRVVVVAVRHLCWREIAKKRMTKSPTAKPPLMHSTPRKPQAHTNTHHVHDAGEGLHVGALVPAVEDADLRVCWVSVVGVGGDGCGLCKKKGGGRVSVSVITRWQVVGAYGQTRQTYQSINQSVDQSIDQSLSPSSHPFPNYLSRGHAGHAPGTPRQ